MEVILDLSDFGYRLLVIDALDVQVLESSWKLQIYPLLLLKVFCNDDRELYYLN